MNKSEVKDLITQSLYESAEENDVEVNINDFSEEGILTNDDGLVIYINNKRFLLTIQEA